MIRTSTGMVWVAPTGITSRSWIALRSFTWVLGEVSPISSRKKVPPEGRHQESVLVPYRARERPLDVSKQLALQEAFGKRAAVDREEGGLAPRGPRVDVLGHDFLPGSALTGDEDGGVGWRHRIGQVENIGESLTLPHGALRPIVSSSLDLLSQLPVLHSERAGLGSAAADREELVI